MLAKKWQVAVVIGLLTVLILTTVGIGCAPKAAPAPGPAPTAAKPGTKYQLNWRISANYPSNIEGGQVNTRFADKVTKATNGRVKLTAYNDAVLGAWDLINEMIMRGDIEMMFEAIDDSYDPRIQIGYYLPFLYVDYASAEKFWKPGGVVYNIMNDITSALGWRVLGAWNAGIGGLTLKNVPKSPWDPNVAKNVKIRTMAITACRVTFERLGYLVTALPFGEVMTAIQTGIVEGQQGGGTQQAYIFRDINKVYLHYKDYIEPVWFSANNKHWATLTKEDQDIITNVAQEEQNLQFAAAKAMDEKYMQMLKDAGWTVLVPTDAEWQKMADAINKDVWPKLLSSYGKANLNQLLKALGKPEM